MSLLDKKLADEHQHASTQINVPEEVAAEIIRIGRELIPDEHLAGNGREELIHVTLKYGVRPDVDKFRQAVAGHKPFKVALGKVVAFTDADTDGIPVVVEAHGHGFEPLHDAIDAAIGNRPDDFPYTAHITIAYVKETEAQHYAGSDAFIGIEFVANEATISMFDDDNQVDVKLAASPAVMPEISEVAPQFPQQEQDEEEVQRDEPATQEEPEEEEQPKPKRQRSPLLQKKQPKPKTFKAPKPPAENRNFKRWFGKSKVKDENGGPLVVYHGTTHDFEEFDPRHANVENHYGQALYFTSSQEDLRSNYATESGPDITSRIDHRTEQIISEWDHSWEDVKDEIGLGDIEEMPNWDSVPGSDFSRVLERAKQEAKKGIAGQTQGMSMPVYLSLQNPVVVEKNGGTQFELNIDEDGNESGSGVDLYAAMNKAAVDYYSGDAQEVWQRLIDNRGESFNAWDFEQTVRSGGEYFEDNEGNQAAGSFIADVYQNMGFDGIIQDAYEAFGPGRRGRGMEMDSDTKHYILWDPHKIKSAIGNAGKYDPKNPVITAAAPSVSISNNLSSGGGLTVESEAGTIVLNTADDDALFVEGIEIADEYRGKGEGQKLYDAAFAAAGKLGYTYVYSSNENNRTPEADAAWERIGQRYDVEDVGDAFRVKVAAKEKSVGDLGLARKIMHELMPVLGVQLPEPELKLSNAPRAGWLGRDTWHTSYNRGYGDWKWGDTTTIDLQRSIINDENTLRRIIAHELCHHAEALTTLTEKIQEAKATGGGEWAFNNFARYMRTSGHGVEFKKWAAKFNAKYGADFVTEKSDESYVVEEQELHPYHILLERNYDGTLGYEVSSRMTPQMRKYLDRLGREEGGYEHRITTTNDRDWMGGPLIGSFYHARPKEPEKQKKLEELWNTAKPFEKFVPLPEGTRVVINDPKSVENKKQGIVKSFNGHDYVVAIENYSLVPEVYFTPSEVRKIAGKRDEAVTSMTVGTTDPEFPIPVLIRWELGMRWRDVLKVVKSIVADLADRRVAWRDIHIWASLWDSHDAQEQGWEQEKAKGSKVMYDILHNGTFVRVDRNGQPVAAGAEEPVVASHKTPPLSDTTYANPEIGEETNAYADIPERVRGQYDVPSLSELAPQLFEKSGAEVTFRTEFRGSHSGQSDIKLVAEVGGKPVGYVDYSVYEGRPAVQYVEVSDKRKGYGTALLRKLQSMFPDIEVSLGGTTPEGTKLVESLEFHEEPTEHAEKFAELETLTQERDKLQAVADEFYATENHTEEEKQAFMRQMEHMNTIHDRIWELEQGTQHESPSKRLISSAEVEYRIEADRAEAWIGDKCIGWVNFIEVAPNDVKEIWIRMVFVNPEYRRTGIATGMYEKIKEEFPGERLVSSGSTPEGGKFREKLLERGVLAHKSILLRKQGDAFRDWLGKTRTTGPSNARDLSVTKFRNDENIPPEPFMGKYTIVKGYSEYRKGFGGEGEKTKEGYYTVFDGDKPIASMCPGSLVVDRKYRNEGIGTALAKEYTQDYPNYRPSSVTPKSKRLFERAWEQNKNAVYGEQQNQVQHTDHQAIGMTKTLNSNPFADEMEALKGEGQVELNPSLEDASKGEGQPRAKGEDKVDMAHAQKMQQASLTPEEQKRKDEDEKGDWLPDIFYEEEPRPREPERHWLFKKNVIAAEEDDFTMSGKVGPFYRIDTMDYDMIRAFHGKRFADKVKAGQKVTVWRAGKPGETLVPGTFLSANKHMAEGYLHSGTESFGGPQMYRYEVDPKDLINVENMEASELVWKPRKTAAKKFPPFDQWVAKYPQLDVEPNLEKEKGQEFEDQPVRSEIEERYSENVQWLSSLDIPLEIYRALEVEKGSEVNLDSAGIHWTWVESSADAYFGGSSMWARVQKPKDPELVILKAMVSNPNSIDFEKTLFNNVQNPNENEITLKPGAKIKLVGVMREDDNSYGPVAQKTVVAAGPVKIDWNKSMFGKFKLTVEYSWHGAGDKTDDNEEIGEDNWNMLVVDAFDTTVKEARGFLGKFAGMAEFVLRGGRLESSNTEVDPEYQRQGVATAIYQFAEGFTGFKVKPHLTQSPAGRALWQQKGRPFGASLLTAAAKPFPSSVVQQIVYHGSNEPFTRVDMSKGAQGVFWVTSDKGKIERGESGAVSSKHIHSMYIDIQKPAGWAEYEQKSLGELKRDYDGVILPEKDGSFDAIVFKPRQVKFVKE